MDREEAIRRLKWVLSTCENKKTSYAIAIDMAIDALQALATKDSCTEPSEQGDLISRADAVNAFDDNIMISGQDNANEVSCYIKETIAKIKALPSVSAERVGEWTLCEEKMPNEETDVIISITDESGDYAFSYTTVGWHYDGHWISYNELVTYVIAWKPLPKPYGARMENEK